MKEHSIKYSGKIFITTILIFAAIILLSATGFKNAENDRELIKDKIMVYMTAVKQGNYSGIIEISGEKLEEDKKKEVLDALAEMFSENMKYELKDFSIKKIDIQGAIAFVTLEEEVKITLKTGEEKSGESSPDQFNKITEEIVLIKRDGKWKIDAVNTLQFSKIKEAFKDPRQFLKLRKTIGVGRTFTVLADPDISFLVIESARNFGMARARGELIMCRNHMRTIGISLEMYGTDFDGRYPDSLAKLTPDYLKAIPDCPAAGKDTYSELYRVSRDPDAYTFYCQGHNHSKMKVPENYPLYSTYLGLDDGIKQKQDNPETKQDNYEKCISNLKMIATALEMYGVDNKGHYPANLSRLNPEYLRSIPTCTTAGKDTYSRSYEVSKDLKHYTIYCKGHYHKNDGIPENNPVFDSTEGIINKGKE